MTELLQNPTFISLAAGVLISLGVVLITTWGRVRRASLEAELKREMIERGMTADDICRIVQSRGGEHCDKNG